MELHDQASTVTLFLRGPLVSLNAKKSCDCWLKKFWSARIPSPFVTVFRFLQLHRKMGATKPKTGKITFCVRGVLSVLLSNVYL